MVKEIISCVVGISVGVAIIFFIISKLSKKEIDVV